MAGGAVDFLVRSMGSLLLQEASLLSGLRDGMDDIRLELLSIQSFLRDADNKRDLDDAVRAWVGQVRDVAYDVEDVVDEFMYHTAKHLRGGAKGALLKVIYLPKSIYYRHHIANQLQQIKSRILDISERGRRYGFSEHGLNAKADHDNGLHYGELAHFVPDNDLVGIEKNKSFLIGWLMDDEPQRKLLSVVGMGGLGKTTLVTKAYNSAEVERDFNCHAWITVSQSYKIGELLRNIMEETCKSNKEAVPENFVEASNRDLLKMVVDYLQPRRYLIVLDDVWDTNVWEDINLAFPDNILGSRVMLTTRKEDVASSLGVGSSVFHLEPLHRDDAWALFCRKAFWNIADRRCPPELEPYAQSLVQKCEGLPLAIAAIGGLMWQKEKTPLEWKKAENSLSWELQNSPALGRMKKILSHSFNDLPHHLKRCFLYCSLFPEDYKIRRNKLIRLWIAEGFVEERRGLMLEEVAETFLIELISRSLLQAIESGLSKSFRMHDLMRELAQSISSEENLCIIYDGKEAAKDRKLRRLSITNSCKNIQGVDMTHLRSLLLFVTDNITSSCFSSMLPDFRLLRVLDLQACPIESITNELTALFNLRYLSLKGTNVRLLPNSLGRLHNLETLDLRDTKVERLPSGVQKMKKLRHMFLIRYTHEDGYKIMDGMEAPPGMCKIKCLQSLEGVEANGEINRQFGHLGQLRKFGIIKVRKEDGMELCSSIQKMRWLIFLHVMAADENETLDLESMSSPPPLLQKLGLTGHLEKLPHWVSWLENLTYLQLNWTRIRDDPFSALKPLPKLVNLVLRKSYDGERLCFRIGCFPRLKILYLEESPFLNLIRIEQGAMPCLQELDLIDCMELKMLPQGIEYLANLQQLCLRGMPEELVERLHGDDFPKVQNVPSIYVYNTKFS